MTKIAIWCRHDGDNIIGAEGGIPWSIPSDLKRFKALTIGNVLVIGKKTYESLPNRTLPNRKFLVVTSDKNYEVADENNHHLVHDIAKLKDYPEDLYIAGGGAVYEAFFATASLMPDIVVDCVYMGKLSDTRLGKTVDVSKCVEIMKQKYFALPKSYELDEVVTTIWLKKGDFVEQSVVKKIMQYLETEKK